MISRYYITCLVCKTHHTLRVQMGYGNEQKHRFQCHHCNEPIKFSLLSEKIEIIGADLTDADKDSDEKTTFQYLSPDFVADSAKTKDPKYFGSFDLMTKILDSSQIDFNLVRSSEEQLPHHDWHALSDATKDWEILQVCWRLERSGRYYLAQERLTALDKEAGTSSWLAAVHLGYRLFGTNETLMSEAAKILGQNTSEASRLVIEHGYNWRRDFMETEFQLFSEFFKRWDALSQVYIYIRNGISMPKNAITTSFDFENVRGFYSMAQEFFAKQTGLITALNNINSGRKFDKLNQISLERYFNIDNARRCENFQNNASLKLAALEFDSGLRNAEAHNWLRANSETQHLTYMQGGKGPVVELHYVEYLYKSMILFQQICHLMQLEAFLRNISLQSAHDLLMPEKIN